MIELLSLIFGFGSSTIPYIFKYFQDAKDKAHELSLLHMQMQNSKDMAAYRLEEIGAMADMQQFTTINDNMFKGSKLTDALNASVPAIYAFTFLALYVLIQIIYAWILKDAGPAVFADQMWTEVDQSFLNAILGHYFGKVSMRQVNR